MTATEMNSREMEYQVRRAAGLVGALQALSWIILSIICIALYIQNPDLPNVRNYMDQVSYMIYVIFLYSDAEPFPKQALTPSVFFGFMWAYLLLDVAWLFTSLKIMKRNRETRQLISDLKLWAHATILISVLDFIIVVILGADYHSCINMYDRPSITLEQECAIGILPVLVIAAKGFVLWIINVIFAKVLLSMSKGLKKSQVFDTAPMSPQVLVQSPYGPSGFLAPTNRQNWSSTVAPYQSYQQPVSISRH